MDSDRSRSSSSDRESCERASRDWSRFPKSGHVSWERSRSMSSDGNSCERTSKNTNERPSRFTERNEKRQRKRQSKSKNRKIYVANIPFDTTSSELEEKFNSVGDVNSVQILKDENDRFKGCALITFRRAETAKKAIQTMNREKFKGRKLVIKEEKDKSETTGKWKRGNANPNSQTIKSLFSPDFDFQSIRPLLAREYGNNPSSFEPLLPSNAPNPVDYRTYGLTREFLDALKIDLPLIKVVFVANLDYTTTESELKVVFSLAGNVLKCEIFKDKEGKSRGFGIVTFEHPVEAVQAISMLHNQTYKDRLLAVRMDRLDRSTATTSGLPAGLESIGIGLGIDGKPLKGVKNLPVANSLATTCNPLEQMYNTSLGRENSTSISPGDGLLGMGGLNKNSLSSGDGLLGMGGISYNLSSTDGFSGMGRVNQDSLSSGDGLLGMGGVNRNSFNSDNGILGLGRINRNSSSGDGLLGMGGANLNSLKSDDGLFGMGGVNLNSLKSVDGLFGMGVNRNSYKSEDGLFGLGGGNRNSLQSEGGLFGMGRMNRNSFPSGDGLLDLRSVNSNALSTGDGRIGFGRVNHATSGSGDGLLELEGVNYTAVSARDRLLRQGRVNPTSLGSGDGLLGAGPGYVSEGTGSGFGLNIGQKLSHNSSYAGENLRKVNQTTNLFRRMGSKRKHH